MFVAKEKFRHLVLPGSVDLFVCPKDVTAGSVAIEFADNVATLKPDLCFIHFGDPTSDDVTIPWVAWGKSVKPGFEITAPVVQYDTAATALWLLGIPVPEGFWGRPVTSAFAP